MSKHLWEVSHSYYCNLGNYRGHEGVESYYKSFAEFLNEWGDADNDYNLLFRWDWNEEDQPFNGDVNYRNGKLYLFWMLQRKGDYRYSVVEVCRNDEAEVLKFIKPRYEYLKALWEPLV